MPEPTGQHTHILQQEPGYENGNGGSVRGDPGHHEQRRNPERIGHNREDCCRAEGNPLDKSRSLDLVGRRNAVPVGVNGPCRLESTKDVAVGITNGNTSVFKMEELYSIPNGLLCRRLWTSCAVDFGN